MFQEIGECMTKTTDSVGSIHDVPSSASLFSVFSGTPADAVFLLFSFISLLLSDCDALQTSHRDHMFHPKNGALQWFQYQSIMTREVRSDVHDNSPMQWLAKISLSLGQVTLRSQLGDHAVGDHGLFLNGTRNGSVGNPVADVSKSGAFSKNRLWTHSKRRCGNYFASSLPSSATSSSPRTSRATYRKGWQQEDANFGRQTTFVSLMNLLVDTKKLDLGVKGCQ